MPVLTRIAKRLRNRFRRVAGPAGDRFFQDHDHYTIEGEIHDTDCLVLSFEDAFKKIDRTDIHRPGWGARLFKRERISHLCFKPKATDWYQHPDFAAHLSDLRASPTFSQFKRTISYGGSMGGFAALAYADHLGVTDVLALNPQTTLNRDLVPWETRFDMARRQTWTGPFSDASKGALKVNQVVVVYDPFVEKDAKHIARLDQPNLIRLRAPFIGHGMAKSLTELKVLVPLLQSIRAGQLDAHQFHKGLRRRKSLPRHLDLLAAQQRVIDSPQFSQIVANARGALSSAPAKN